MLELPEIGARLRRRRLDLGFSQQSIARKAGVSASYLNLIEHNKRTIGGKKLADLAAALDTDVSTFTKDTDAVLIQQLHFVGAETAEDAAAFAEKFPGWAQIVAGLSLKVAQLEQNLVGLSDRMAHDPVLSGALHQVLSTVTSIRSSSSILMEGAGDKDWEERFHRNIHNDSLRLAQVSKDLVQYFESSGAASELDPLREAMGYWDAHNGHFPMLEQGGELDLSNLSVLAAKTVQDWSRCYHKDAQVMPLRDAVEQATVCGYDPGRFATYFAVDLQAAMRRLATLPLPAGPRVGCAVCDAAGNITFLKEIPGFSMSRQGGACPNWPLFQALSRPGIPLLEVMEMPGNAEPRLTCYAVSGPLCAVGFDDPPMMQAMMLVVADAPQQSARKAGHSCQICPVEPCPARRHAMKT